MFPTLAKFKKGCTTKAPPISAEEFRKLQSILFATEMLIGAPEGRTADRAHATFSLYLAGVHVAEYARDAGISFEEELKSQMADGTIRTGSVVYTVVTELLENDRIARDGTTAEKIELWRRKKSVKEGRTLKPTARRKKKVVAPVAETGTEIVQIDVTKFN
jgi:hypothetical protein